MRVTRSELQSRILDIREKRRDLRREEEQLKAKRKLRGQPLIADDDFERSVNSIIPHYLAPKNIGELDTAMWDFTFPMTVDFGQDPTYGPLTSYQVRTQVTREASFLCCGISHVAESANMSGMKAPLSITIRDNQSTRQFNNEPFPLQLLGNLGQPLMFDTPIIFAPNSNIEIDISSWLENGLQTFGSGKHEFVLHGMRVRSVDDAKVLASIWL